MQIIHIDAQIKAEHVIWKYVISASGNEQRDTNDAGYTPILPVPTLEATHVSHFREASQRTTIGGTSGGGVGT